MKVSAATAKAHRIAASILIPGLVRAHGDAKVRAMAPQQMAHHQGALSAYVAAKGQASLQGHDDLVTTLQHLQDKETGSRDAWKAYLDTDPKVLADQAAQG